MARQARDERAAREEDAVLLLREAVFASRARQAAAIAPPGLRPAPEGPAGSAGNCGLGAKALVDLRLSEKAAGAFARLFPAGGEADGSGPALEPIQGLLGAWVEAQDALDRARNHFLRDFRTRHGFDRAAYTPEERQAFEEGLAKVNARESERLHEHARQLLALAGLA